MILCDGCPIPWYGWVGIVCQCLVLLALAGFAYWLASRPDDS